MCTLHIRCSPDPYTCQGGTAMNVLCTHMYDLLLYMYVLLNDLLYGLGIDVCFNVCIKVCFEVSLE
jgi:hypothetical protein